MVVFICDGCGESLKKNVVDKHFQSKCRNRPPLSCVDCQKHFGAEEWRNHNACMTEQEKWHGKDYKPKEASGKKKQDSWMENIQNAISGAQGKDPKLNGLLQKLLNHENVPRKEAKFRNFVKNCLRVYDERVLTAVWNIVSVVKPETNENVADKATDQVKAAVNGDGGEVQKSESVNEEKDVIVPAATKRPADEDNEEEPRKSKKKKAKSAESQNVSSDSNGLETNGDHKPAAETRSSGNGSESENTDPVPAVIQIAEESHVEEEPRKSKKKKSKVADTEDIPLAADSVAQEESQVEPTDASMMENGSESEAGKFNWKKAMKKFISESKKGALKKKKLQRKVVMAYCTSQGIPFEITPELVEKFESRLQKNSKHFVVDGATVRSATSH